MKRKIIFSIISLSIILSLVGCQSASNGNTTEAKKRSDTDSAVFSDTDSIFDSDKEKTSDSPRDTDEAIITDDDKKELASADMEETSDTNTEGADEPEEEEDNISPSSIDLGGYTLSAEKVSVDNPLKITDRDSLDCVLSGDSLYVLNNRSVTVYTLSDSGAEKINTIRLDSNYKKIDADPYGQIYLSNDIFNIAQLNDDGTVTELDETGYLALSKVMDYGLSFFNGEKEITKFRSEDDSDIFIENADETEVTDSVFDSVSDIEFVGNHVLVGGTSDEKNTRVAVYDYEGDLLAVTDNKVEGKGIDSMTETDSGLMVSSLGNLSVWNSDGTEIAQTKSSETAKLFGSENPVRISKLIAMDDGSVLALCSEETEKDKYQSTMYRIYGF